MNPLVKQLWLEALRSGKYTQAHGQLRRQRQPDEIIEGDDSPVDSYCCLGVLCDLHAQITGQGEWLMRNGIGKYICDVEGHEYRSESELPEPVAEWAFPGQPWMDWTDPLVRQLVVPVTLSRLNDEFKPFTEIADIIDAHL